MLLLSIKVFESLPWLPMPLPGFRWALSICICIPIQYRSSHSPAITLTHLLSHSLEIFPGTLVNRQLHNHNPPFPPFGTFVLPNQPIQSPSLSFVSTHVSHPGIQNYLPLSVITKIADRKLATPDSSSTHCLPSHYSSNHISNQSKLGLQYTTSFALLHVPPSCTCKM